MSNQRNDPNYELCQFQFANGKHCAMPAHPRFNGLCLNHGSLNRRGYEREDDLITFMAIPSGAVLTQEEIQLALGKLFEALAGNRISTRRAATLAYIGFLLLQTYSGLKAEARMTELQGAKDLRMLLKMKYGNQRPATRRQGENGEQRSASCERRSGNGEKSDSRERVTQRR